MTSPFFLEEDQKKTQIALIEEELKTNKNLSFREFQRKLAQEGKESWFLDLKISDIIKYKEIKHYKNQPIHDIKEYTIALLTLLKEKGLGTSKRGLSTLEILENISGNAPDLRKLLKELFKERKVYPTGETQGQKWVIWELKNQAENNWNNLVKGKR